MNARPLIYLAAPLFSEAELGYNIEIAKVLECRFDVYLPQRDGLLVADLVRDGFDSDLAKDLVFHNDIDALERADALLILLDGRTVDEGAAFELGIAYWRKLPCFGLQTGPRRLLPHGNNPMIDGALAKTFRSVDELRDWVEGDCALVIESPIQLTDGLSGRRHLNLVR